MWKCGEFKVIPFIVALFRREAACHYQAVRFSEEDNANFLHSEPIDHHPSMRDRLDLVHVALGWNAAGQATIYEFDVVPPAQPATVGPEPAQAMNVAIDTRSTRGMPRVG